MSKKIISFFTATLIFLSTFAFNISAKTLSLADIPPECKYIIDSKVSYSDGSYKIIRRYSNKPLVLSVFGHMSGTIPTLATSGPTLHYDYILSYASNGDLKKTVTSSTGGFSILLSEIEGLEFLISTNFEPPNLDEFSKKFPNFVPLLKKFFDNVDGSDNSPPLEVAVWRIDVVKNLMLPPDVNISFTISNKTNTTIPFYFTYDSKAFENTNVSVRSAEHLLYCKKNLEKDVTIGGGFVAKPGLNNFYIPMAALPYLDIGNFNFWLGAYRPLNNIPSDDNMHGPPKPTGYSLFSFKCFDTRTYDFKSNDEIWDDNDNIIIDDGINDLIDPDNPPDFLPDLSDFSFENFIPTITSLFSELNGLLDFFKKAFEIFPATFWSLVSMGLVITIILRVFGR